MMIKSRPRGFTLIEILIAMLMLSMVMFIGSLSFSTFSQRWQKDMGSFTQEVANAKNLVLLQKVFSGIANYIVKDDQQQPVYFFKGNEKYLMFVTNTPIFNTETQALIRLSVTLDEKGNQQLLYREAPFTSSPLMKLNTLPEANYSQVILTDDNIRFNYFGWEDQAQRAASLELDDEPTSPKWLQQYWSDKTSILPYGINITWGENEPIIFPVANDNAYQLIYSLEKRRNA